MIRSLGVFSAVAAWVRQLWPHLLPLPGSGGSRRRLSSDQKTVERTFKNVFAMVSPDRREAIISFYIKERKVGRVDAMLIAIANRRWRA